MSARNGLVRIGKKVIGQIDRDKKVFAKQVSIRKGHLYRTLDAWGIDGNFFEQELLPEDYRIRVFEADEGKVYETNARTYKEHGQWRTHKDYGLQIFLSRQYWT